MQKFKLELSKYIASDLEDTLKYLPETKYNKLIQELNAKFLNLTEMPQMYQRLYYDAKKKDDYRRIICEKHIVTYKIHKNQITILRIVSEKTDYLKSNFFKIY